MQILILNYLYTVNLTQIPIPAFTLIKHRERSQSSTNRTQPALEPDLIVAP